MMAVVVAVTMVMVVVMIVRVITMRVSRCVGASLRIERRFDYGQPRAKILQQRFERGIVPYAQPVA